MWPIVDTPIDTGAWKTRQAYKVISNFEFRKIVIERDHENVKYVKHCDIPWSLAEFIEIVW